MLLNNHALSPIAFIGGRFEALAQPPPLVCGAPLFNSIHHYTSGMLEYRPKARRADDVGDWLLQAERLGNWCDGNSQDESRV